MVKLMANCFRWIKGRNKPPKNVTLVIIGLDDAGKSTTVASLQGEPPDGITPTIGFCNASLTFGKWNVTLYDLGGGKNVRTVWEKYYAEIHGIIFAVDSSNKDRLREAKEVLSNIFEDARVQGKPIAIFANKQDKEGASDENEILQELDIEELSQMHSFQFKVFPCSAIKGYGKDTDTSIKGGIEWLLESINEDFLTIHEKVERESAIQKEKDSKDRKERLERIRKLREERELAAKEAGIEESEEESDDDVVTGNNNPFRKIDDQIVVTEKREKKEKEKAKKIKAYQQNKENQNQDSEEETKKPKKRNRKKKKKKEVIEETDSEEEEDSLRRRHPSILVEEPTPRSSDEVNNTSPKKKRKKKKKQKPAPEESAEEDIKYTDKRVENVHNSHTVIQVNSLEDVKGVERRKKKKVNSPKSSEDISSDNEDVNVKKVVKKPRALPKLEDRFSKPVNDIIESNGDEGYDDTTSQQAINDSRADLFRAKSSDNLQSSEISIKKFQKITEEPNENNVKRKKKKKKKNKTVPNLTSSPTNDDDEQRNGHLSKLQPIKLKGRLPDLESQYSSAPSWARARPNSEDHDVMT